MSTKIEWAEETWNPVIGCSKISTGCQNCYAEKMAGRLANMGNEYYQSTVKINRSLSPEPKEMPMFSSTWTGKTRFVESALKKPFHWKKPRRIFVCSMGDLFHESVPFSRIIEVFHIMMKCPQHTFLLLTKRADRMREFMCEYVPNPYGEPYEPLPNVWFGVTFENQDNIWRIDELLKIPAAKRFVSIEPMLSDIDLDDYLPIMEPDSENRSLNWVIVGAESGPKRRECKTEWVESIIEQCEAANVPVMVKQLFRNGKKAALPEINGKIYNEYPI